GSWLWARSATEIVRLLPRPGRLTAPPDGGVVSGGGSGARSRNRTTAGLEESPRSSSRWTAVSVYSPGACPRGPVSSGLEPRPRPGVGPLSAQTIWASSSPTMRYDGGEVTSPVGPLIEGASGGSWRASGAAVSGPAATQARIRTSAGQTHARARGRR